MRSCVTCLLTKRDYLPEALDAAGRVEQAESHARKSCADRSRNSGREGSSRVESTGTVRLAYAHFDFYFLCRTSWRSVGGILRQQRLQEKVNGVTLLTSPCPSTITAWSRASTRLGVIVGSDHVILNSRRDSHRLYVRKAIRNNSFKASSHSRMRARNLESHLRSREEDPLGKHISCSLPVIYFFAVQGQRQRNIRCILSGPE